VILHLIFAVVLGLAIREFASETEGIVIFGQVEEQMHLTSSSLKNKDNQTELPYQDLQSPACYI
jgi:hypothetical protein